MKKLTAFLLAALLLPGAVGCLPVEEITAQEEQRTVATQAVVHTSVKEEVETTTEAVTERVVPKHEDLDFSPISIEQVRESEVETDYVMIDVQGYGKIVIRLFADVAPITVANFKSLVSEQYYDGIIFHRVIKNFMIQGGDPDGDGISNSNVAIPGEFTLNGFENNLRHVRGVVSMARTMYPDSAFSQFFICQQDYAYGDGNYAAFGYVVCGMDVVDAIADTATGANDKPLEDVVMSSVRFVTVA